MGRFRDADFSCEPSIGEACQCAMQSMHATEIADIWPTDSCCVSARPERSQRLLVGSGDIAAALRFHGLVLAATAQGRVAAALGRLWSPDGTGSRTRAVRWPILAPSSLPYSPQGLRPAALSNGQIHEVLQTERADVVGIGREPLNDPNTMPFGIWAPTASIPGSPNSDGGCSSGNHPCVSSDPLEQTPHSGASPTSRKKARTWRFLLEITRRC